MEIEYSSQTSTIKNLLPSSLRKEFRAHENMENEIMPKQISFMPILNIINFDKNSEIAPDLQDSLDKFQIFTAQDANINLEKEDGLNHRISRARIETSGVCKYCKKILRFRDENRHLLECLNLMLQRGSVKNKKNNFY